MTIEIVTFQNRARPVAHTYQSITPPVYLEFQRETLGIDRVTVFKSWRKAKAFLAAEGYQAFERVDHRLFSTVAA